MISRRGIESGSYLDRFEVVIILDAAKRFSVHLRSRFDFIFLVRLILAGYIASVVAVFYLSLLFSFARLVFFRSFHLPSCFRHITARSAQFSGPHALWPCIVGVRLVTVHTNR